MREAPMKGNLQRKVQWWACRLVGIIFCISCAAKAPVPEPATPPPAPRERAHAPKQVSPTPAPTPERVSPEPAPVPTPPAKIDVKAPVKKTYFTHTIRFSGETVSIIAGWYTGDIENWKVLAEANPQIDPKRVFVGNKILIPEDMLKTRELMPKEFVDGFYKPKKGKVPATKPKPSPADEKEPELFGPK